MACVDHAEAVPLRIRKHHEIGVGRVQIPPDAGGTKADQALDFGGLLGRVVDDEIEMNPWMVLGRRLRALQRNPSAFTRRWDQDREFVVGVRETNGLVPENVGPKRHRSVDVIGAEHHGSEAKHEASLTQRGCCLPSTSPHGEEVKFLLLSIGQSAAEDENCL